MCNDSGALPSTSERLQPDDYWQASTCSAAPRGPKVKHCAALLDHQLSGVQLILLLCVFSLLLTWVKLTSYEKYIASYDTCSTEGITSYNLHIKTQRNRNDSDRHCKQHIFDQKTKQNNLRLMVRPYRSQKNNLAVWLRYKSHLTANLKHQHEQKQELLRHMGCIKALVIGSNFKLHSEIHLPNIRSQCSCATFHNQGTFSQLCLHFFLECFIWDVVRCASASWTRI